MKHDEENYPRWESQEKPKWRKSEDVYGFKEPPVAFDSLDNKSKFMMWLPSIICSIWVVDGNFEDGQKMLSDIIDDTNDCITNTMLNGIGDQHLIDAVIDFARYDSGISPTKPEWLPEDWADNRRKSDAK